MSVDRRRLRVAPFRSEHVEPAARLLAARHARDRHQTAALPDAFEQADATMPLVREAFLTDGTSGFVAMLGGEPVGFLLGQRTSFHEDSTIAPYYQPRSVLIRYDAHATGADGSTDIYRELYAAAAEHWAADRLMAHYIQLPATDAAGVDAWASIGFGRDMGWGLRDTRDIDRAAISPGLTIRRAVVDDLDIVFDLDSALVRHEARSPVFMPYPTDAAEQEWKADLRFSLADPRTRFWLAELDGRAVGLLNVNPPPLHISPLLTPDGMVNIFAASVAPDHRGTGVGVSLLRHALDDARARGFGWCRMSWMTANLYSSRFWSRHGFCPVAWRMSRVIDERAIPRMY